MINRQLNKLLGPAVIFIWILVIWQFWGKGNDTFHANRSNQQFVFTGEAQLADSFSLLNPYRDPFLDRLPEVVRAKTSVNTRRTSKVGTLVKKPQKNPVRIPLMVYQGGVQRTETDPITGILQIDRKIYTIRKGDSLAGVHIVDLQMNNLLVAIGDTAIQVFR